MTLSITKDRKLALSITDKKGTRHNRQKMTLNITTDRKMTLSITKNRKTTLSITTTNLIAILCIITEALMFRTIMLSVVFLLSC
jgi:hypothetical protein